MKELLVEGKNDQHVIWNLCKQHNIPEVFSVRDGMGVDKLLRSIPVRLKISGLEVLGIVLDADQDVAGRWRAVCEQLQRAGYVNLPDSPDSRGTIIYEEERPRVGIWLMPNNSSPGMLEDFVSYLIPDEDALKPKAENILNEIEDEGLARYGAHHQKAFIHTWLAWQETPGQPMGQAITARVLRADNEIVQIFVDWLNLLFNS